MPWFRINHSCPLALLALGSAAGRSALSHALLLHSCSSVVIAIVLSSASLGRFVPGPHHPYAALAPLVRATFVSQTCTYGAIASIWGCGCPHFTATLYLWATSIAVDVTCFAPIGSQCLGSVESVSRIPPDNLCWRRMGACSELMLIINIQLKFILCSAVGCFDADARRNVVVCQPAVKQWIIHRCASKGEARTLLIALQVPPTKHRVLDTDTQASCTPGTCAHVLVSSMR